MNIAATSLRGKALIAALVALLVAGVSLVLLLGGSQSAVADANPSNLDCHGHLEKGEPSPDDPTAIQVKYVFGCNGAITGYQIQPDHEATSIETEVFALDPTTKEVVPTDAFSCNGDIPGYGINCTGTYGGSYRIVKGQFSIDSKLCKEPRIDALLSVVYATGAIDKEKVKVTQYISGPYELGRPLGCPRSTRAGKTRIPREKLESAE